MLRQVTMTSMVKLKRMKTAQTISENASEKDDPKSSTQATAVENKKAPEPIASDILEKSKPEEVVDPVTFTATNTSDAISPND
ncbi:hypothetical protein F2Q70_00042319 [Brassica cretica]|uniref:Uncharacterized protein n=1 Tax=Brassica cretica TaxID=69181 RepID=A0A8S9KIJ3_BRACR|nr:hypothetical protein F2Q70_00042319 [Brassica cretica]